MSNGACERIVVLNKRDLVPEWGMEVKAFIPPLIDLGWHLLSSSIFSPFETPWLRNFRVNTCSSLPGKSRGTLEI
jgi:hypothetical protein